MATQMTPTIFAPITGRGGAVTVFRLSGPSAFTITSELTTLPPPRRASLRTLTHNAQILDHALVTTFPAPHSFTGEDCVELSLHGGLAVATAVATALVTLGARPAEPGEFSRRAFHNNRLDLLQAEAIADLIASETESQRRLAIDGADATQSACATWRETLRLLIAQQEVLIDFPDEDLPTEVETKLLSGIQNLHNEMLKILSAAPAATRLREGLEFVILGPPNAGKSTLLNVLAEENIAIVSATPGTTRDAVGTRLNLGGVPVHLTDTAGLRDTTDEIEAEGIARARARAARADLIILTAAAPTPLFPQPPRGIETLHVITKSDLLEFPPLGFLSVSAQTGDGIAKLRETLTKTAARLTDTRGAAPLTRPRQIACIRDVADALAAALAAPDPELRAEDLRSAATALARLTGSIGVEEILDAVFNSFCIGK
jgi:tRNA modification GTPase